LKLQKKGVLLMRIYRYAPILLILVLLAACGGSATDKTAAPSLPTIQTENTVSLETPTLAHTGTPSLITEGEFIYYGLRERLGEGYADLGVFRVDPKTSELKQIAPEGWNLQDVSPDGSRLLINQGSQLYSAYPDGSGTRIISGQFYDYGARGAAWNSDGNRIVFIYSGDSGPVLVRSNPDGSEPEELGSPGDSPIEIEDIATGGDVFWQKGTCSGQGVCTREGSYRTAPAEAGSSQPLKGLDRLKLSPDGSRIAYSYENDTGKSSLGTAASDFSSKIAISLPGDLLGDFSWSPDGTRMAVVRLDRSDYSGKVSGTRNFVVDTTNGAVKEYAESEGILGRVLFSPDGSKLLLWSTTPAGEVFAVVFTLLDTTTGVLVPLQEASPDANTNFLLVTNLIWTKPNQ
jgi:dipeptidyl aminopeptidase/acylaminoacyl peptidase